MINIINIAMLLGSSILVVTVALEQLKDFNEEEIKSILEKYFKKVPDMEPKFVINEAISKAIAHYYKGAIDTFPLYKISLKIDRSPVKIPWIFDREKQANGNITKKRYEYKKYTKIYKYRK